MDGMDYWRLADELTVLQAALLIVDQDPSEYQEYIQSYEAQARPRGYDAAFAALKHAILSKRLPATIRHLSTERGWDEEPEEGASIERGPLGMQYIRHVDPAWDRTTVLVDDLRAWLRMRGLMASFFFPTAATSAVPYLDTSHPSYAPKLAAAINAWESVSSDPSSSRNKTPKQALLIWLRKNAAQFGLTKEDGNPNEQGIEEVSKIANWDLKGGAPKTPGS